MKAIITTDIKESKVKELPQPTPDEKEVLICTKRVQLSVTECWKWLGQREISNNFRDRMVQGDGLVLGHEFCGEIVETGSAVDTFDEGERVYAPDKIPCYQCAYCNVNEYFHCENKAVIGQGKYPGALAEYFVARPEALRSVPADISDSQAAAMQPLSASVLAMHDAKVNTGDVVAVMGSGVMGSQCGQIANAFGASRVFGIDTNHRTLKIVSELGLIPIDARNQDPLHEIRQRNDGIGPDIVVCAVGGDQRHGTKGSDPRAQAFRLLRAGGSLVQVGHINGELTTDPNDLHSKAAQIIYPRSANGVLTISPNSDTGKMALQLVRDGRVNIKSYITHELKGLESFEKAIDITTNKAQYQGLGPAQMIITS